MVVYFAHMLALFMETVPLISGQLLQAKFGPTKPSTVWMQEAYGVLILNFYAYYKASGKVVFICKS